MVAVHGGEREGGSSGCGSGLDALEVVVMFLPVRQQSTAFSFDGLVHIGVLVMARKGNVHHAA